MFRTMFSVKISYLGFFKHRTAKMVANDGRNPTQPTDELGFALDYRHIDIIRKNTLVLE